MELKDTIDLMLSIDYKDRFRAEYYELSIRIQKLEKMLDDWKDGLLKFEPKCGFSKLYEQYVYMKLYRDILAERAEIENIDISMKG